MIAELTFNNFRFFKGEKVISFFPDKRIKRLLSNSVLIDDANILKTIGIYGQNNSGKTNLLELFAIFKCVMSGSDNFIINRDIFGDSKIASFSLTYNNNDGLGWLRYSFSYDCFDRKFVAEKLTSITFYDNGSPYCKDIFSKDIENKVFKVFDNDEVEMMNILSPKRPLLFLLELDSGRFSELKEYYRSLKKAADSIELIRLYNIPIEKTISTLKENNKQKSEFVLSFVKNADLSVSNFYFDQNSTIQIDKSKIDEKALKDLELFEEKLHLVTKYGDVSVPSLFFDSSGTKKIEAIASYILDSIMDGKTLIVDEIDNGLHYKLTRAIVSAFNNLANKKGQLVFTAHDLLLIDCNDLMRKDQIYFVNRLNNCSSDIVCLKKYTAESGTREIKDIVKRYNHGDFGYTPSPSFIKNILSFTAINNSQNGKD